MNRKLLVTLLRKNIQELEMITEGFMEMNEFPAAIIMLAQRKAEEIETYIQQLATLKSEFHPVDTGEIAEATAEVVQPNAEDTWTKPEEEEEAIETEVAEEVGEETLLSEEFTTGTELTNETTVTNQREQTVQVIEVSKTSQTITHELNIQTTVDESRKRVLGDKTSSTSQSRNDLLSKTDHSISSSLANKKITDIKKAINIGDRFRFQRELFHGNGEDMNKTLAYLNQLASKEEALSFVETKYGWAPDNDTAEDFRQIIRRRFI